MILTQCASCAAELPRLARQCSRCKTRYCGPACQKQHWEGGGHDKRCKKIRKGGGAEQYHADQKYAEATTVAAEACADDTKGQTCYICTEAVHRHTKEGLVRGCACHATEGFVHVSCLAEQAKILVAEGEENNLDMEPRWAQWHTCGLCEQDYHGVVFCALGWACWKTYVGRPEEDRARGLAMSALGNGLFDADHHEAALSVFNSRLSLMRRLGTSKFSMLVLQGNLASTYYAMGYHEKAFLVRQDLYSAHLKLFGEEDINTLGEVVNYTASLVCLKRYEEAKSLMRKMMPVARRVLGESHEFTLKMRWQYAEVLYKNASTTLDDLREAVATLNELTRTARRVLGSSHPVAMVITSGLRDARAALRAREAPPN